MTKRKASIVGVLLDKDGTLTDFDRTWGPSTYAIIAALADGDPERMRVQADRLQFSLEEKRFLPDSPLVGGSLPHYAVMWGEALGRTDFDVLEREIDALSAIEVLKAVKPLGEPAKALGALKAMGLRIGVATNDSEASARRQLEALGLDEAIEFVAGYDSGYGGKPGPGMVIAFARHLGAPPERVAVVGDSPHDLMAARAAGALAIAVLSGPVGRDALAPLADHVLPDVAALPALMAKLTEG